MLFLNFILLFVVTDLKKMMKRKTAPPLILSLTLLKARILFVDYKKFTLALNNLAICTTLFD
jgi:hypothetical protein